MQLLMSNASSLTSSPQSPGKPKDASRRAKLTEAQRKQAVSEVFAGEAIATVARRFGITRQSLSSLTRNVRKAGAVSLATKNWRQELVDELPQYSVNALKRSICDDDDKHKAAGTAIAHLKGIGVLAGENQANVNVFIQAIAQLPSDWQARYVRTPGVVLPQDVVDVVPGNGAHDDDPT
jgi:transposase-like protein